MVHLIYKGECRAHARPFISVTNWLKLTQRSEEPHECSNETTEGRRVLDHISVVRFAVFGFLVRSGDKQATLSRRLLGIDVFGIV